jgi:predicted GIY-YIG superfamily endonuclease
MTAHLVYRYYAHDDTLLYIGVTNAGLRRAIQHMHDKSWFPQVVHSTFEHFTNRSSAEAREKEAIRAEHPLYNVVYNVPPVNPHIPVRMKIGGVTVMLLAEAARRYGIDRTTLFRQAKKGALGAWQEGKSWFVTDKAMDDYMRDHASGDGRRGRPRKSPPAPPPEGSMP